MSRSTAVAAAGLSEMSWQDFSWWHYADKRLPLGFLPNFDITVQQAWELQPASASGAYTTHEKKELQMVAKEQPLLAPRKDSESERWRAAARGSKWPG